MTDESRTTKPPPDTAGTMVSLRAALNRYHAATTSLEKHTANDLILMALKQREWEWTVAE
jgi:hypothetical protein